RARRLASRRPPVERQAAACGRRALTAACAKLRTPGNLSVSGTRAMGRGCLWWIVALAFVSRPHEAGPDLDVVLAEDAGGDAVASLAMILRAHGSQATLDEIGRAIYADGHAMPTAQDVVRAAGGFGLNLRGVQLDTQQQLTRL